MSPGMSFSPMSELPFQTLRPTKEKHSKEKDLKEKHSKEEDSKEKEFSNGHQLVPATVPSGATCSLCNKPLQRRDGLQCHSEYSAAVLHRAALCT
uniref:Uncharacterized protein n=1 Tax=Paramormyrops kingsleyae TaxID=1676925 RepID=A0A3B3SID7_9TELE